MSSTNPNSGKMRVVIDGLLAFNFPDDDPASDTRPITLETRRMSRDDSLLAALNQEPLRPSSVDELKPVMLSLGVDLDLEPIPEFYAKLLETHNPHGYTMWEGYLIIMNTCLRTPYFADKWPFWVDPWKKEGDVLFIGPTRLQLDFVARTFKFLSSPSDPAFYRTVVRQPFHARIFERLVKRRFNELTREIFGFGTKRFGFMANWTVFDAAKQVKDAILVGTPSIFVRLAIKSPLTNAWWPAIVRVMIELGLPKNLILLMKSYFDKRIVSNVWTDGPNHVTVLKCEKPMTKGCPAGSVLAPVMWNLLLWDLISKFEKTNPESQLISYGDELYLAVSAFKNVKNLQKLTQQSIDFVQNWCLDNKMELDSDATKVMFHLFESNRLKLNIKNPNKSEVIKQIQIVKSMDIFGLNAQTVIDGDEAIWKRKLNERFANVQTKFDVYVKVIQQKK